MNRKTTKAKSTTKQATESTGQQAAPEPTTGSGQEQAANHQPKPPKATPNKQSDVPVDDPFEKVVLSGKGKKLSPKTQNHVFFEVAINKGDDRLYLRLSRNEGGGLHSKRWLLVDDVIVVLDQQKPKVPFKSVALRDLYGGGSANNAGFLAAALRSKDLGLIQASDKSPFLHVLNPDYEAAKAKLLALSGK
ncbi:hypothetical protein [Photobacterium rosenbergii]|uniref:Uncharacterized protein n=1 Tax=Photobacterium rosenbergii TaxID=294936 RepID=A0ABU3ZLK0_9GAMM|nr:hypothetical protein [Photobacterium rosenbergii]MDV5170988.1 hypothetical protein [Photobacterium rosenbergii]